ncbi:MAG: hypothetical protein NTX38_12855 [Methylobacter sp.]|nr:hypothetical protein [Methylobacter sp.]
MNHARLIFEDAPEFIPVPREMQHRKVEITFLPLDDELTVNSTPETHKNLLLSDEFLASLENIDKPRSLLELIGKGKGCFNNAAEVDAFIRAERDAWGD